MCNCGRDTYSTATTVVVAAPVYSAPAAGYAVPVYSAGGACGACIKRPYVPPCAQVYPYNKCNC